MVRERGFVEVEGGGLWFERDGDGPAVVLIPGGMLDVRMWGPQVESLSDRYTIVRCDLRGYGRSSMPTEDPYRHCDDLRHVFEELGIDRAVAGGQSLGGTVALDFAFAYAERVRGLVLAPALPVNGWKWVEGSPVAQDLRLARGNGVKAVKAVFLDLPLCASAMELPEVATLLRQMVDDYSGWHLRHRDPGVFEAPTRLNGSTRLMLRHW